MENSRRIVREEINREMVENHKKIHLEKYSKEHQQWISFLCKHGSTIEYKKIEYESRSAVFAIMKYRRLLRSRSLGNISFLALNTAHIQKNYIKLHSLLQELFLEAIDDTQFDFILNKINNTENGISKLYHRHKEDTNLRVMSIVLTL